MTTISGAVSWAALQSQFAGEMILPDDERYDDARAIWNADADRRPLAIAKCAGVADVIEAVKFARAENVLVAVRSGGHSYPGHSAVDDGMIIDLSQMRGIQVDPEARIMRAQAGVRLGDVDRENAAFGLALPSGVVSGTGMAGLALGGGFGRLTRLHGLTCDTFLRLDVVTADGELVHASPTENRDLFWGLRGGGGNFGIVTQFECRVFPVDPVQSGWLYYSMDHAAEVLRATRDLPVEGPRELSLFTVLGNSAATTFSPVDASPTDRLIGVQVFYAGSPYDMREALGVLDHIPSVGGEIVTKTYLEAQHEFDWSNAYGTGWYMKSGQTRTLSDELIEVAVDRAPKHGIDGAVLAFNSHGGRMSEVGEMESAASGREGNWHLSMQVAFKTAEEREHMVGWAKDTYNALSPLLDLGTAYVNFMDDSKDLSQLERVYGAEKFRKLRELKTVWDPENFFRRNSNIPPLGPDGADKEKAR
jgi:FAD/FMN-containing dehydrogenase